MSVNHAPVKAAVSVEQAVQTLIAHTAVLGTEFVPLEDASGRVLACPFVSPFPLPPFRRAAMDGYAVRAESIRSACAESPARLPVYGERKPGSGEAEGEADGIFGSLQDAGRRAMFAEQGKLAGGVMRIFTGAPVPAPYDTVVVQEAVDVVARPGLPREVRVDRPWRLGQHVAEMGEDVPAGERLLEGGTVLGSKEIAILASFGLPEVAVFRKPRIEVIPVGDELVMPGNPLGDGLIYDANGFMIQARMRELGAAVVRHRPVPDEREAIRSAIRHAAQTADIVVTTGGVSVGDYDFAKWAAEQAGGRPLFTKVLMRPGTPTSAYAFDACLLVCLSGNPSACFAGMELLLGPAVLKASGRAAYEREWNEGRLEASIDKPSPYPRYIRVSVQAEDGGWKVSPLHNDKSGNVAAFARANALALIPPGGGGATAGQTVRWLGLE